MRSDMDHSFTCKFHHACLYFPAAEHHRPLAGTHFTVPRRVEGWVDLGGWLHAEIECRLRESNPDTVTHPSTNRAQRTLTSMIEINDVTTTPRRNDCYRSRTYVACTVCVSVRWAHGWDVQKRPNRSRCRFGGWRMCVQKTIMRWSTGEGGRGRREEWQDGTAMRPFTKLLWTLVWLSRGLGWVLDAIGEHAASVIVSRQLESDFWEFRMFFVVW